MTGGTVRAAAVPLLALATGCALLLALSLRSSAAVAVLPLALLACVLLARPGLALAALLVPVMALEDDTSGYLPVQARFYQTLHGLHLSPPDVLLLLLAGAVLLDLARRRRALQPPGPFGLPLLIVGLAVVGGLVTGHFAGAGHGATVNDLHTLLFLLVLPPLAAHVFEADAARRAFVAGAAALALVKGLQGLVAWGSGGGRTIEYTSLTFYQPSANWLLVTFLLTLLAAVLMRVRLSWWVKWTAPLALLVLVLSLRRSFWVAALIGACVVMVAAGPRRSLRAVPVLVSLVATVAFAVAVAGPHVETTLLARAGSVVQSHVSTQGEDLYRSVERQDVLDEIARHPVTGLGLGVPWTATHPLPVVHPNGQFYTHVVFLWWWLKLGVLGLLAYVLLIATAIVTGLRVWRRLPGRLEGVAGLALASSLVGMVAAETTASFTGVDLRFTTLLAASFGWLAASHANSPAAPARPGAASRVFSALGG